MAQSISARLKLGFALIASTSLCWAAAAQAADNKYVWKMTTLNQDVYINYANPYECDVKTQNGVSRWNQASRFKATNAGFLEGDIVKNTPGVYVSYEAAVNMANGAGTPAEAPPGSSSGTVVIDGRTLAKISDADIRINKDHWVQSYIVCGESGTALADNQIDHERLVAHEMGHVVGVDDQTTDTSCLSYYKLQYKVLASSPCATEAGFAVRLNGAP